MITVLTLAGAVTAMVLVALALSRIPLLPDEPAVWSHEAAHTEEADRVRPGN